jgi:Transposase IS116/IS110/IS902 family
MDRQFTGFEQRVDSAGLNPETTRGVNARLLARGAPCSAWPQRLSLGESPGLRSSRDHCHRDRGDARQRCGVRERAPIRGLARSGARQYSSGGKARLGRITKAGDAYLRSLLVLGARAVLNAAAAKRDSLSRWALAVRERRGYWKAVVAIAAKNARMAWAVLTKGESFKLPT